MKNKKIIASKLSMLFQMESYNKVSYSLFSKEWGFNSPISDNICIDCKTIMSNYRSIKVNDIVEMSFRIEPAFMNENCNPSGFGWLDKDRTNKKYCFHLFVPSSLPERLESILNRGIKPYFDLNCEKSKYENATIKTFIMESEIDLDDYINI